MQPCSIGSTEDSTKHPVEVLLETVCPSLGFSWEFLKIRGYLI